MDARTLPALTLLAALTLTLTGCAAQDAPVDTNATVAPVVVATETPAATETAEATVEAVETEAPAPEPEIVADEFSQVINGVLYVGTEKAPVRIGTDTPGQAPALEANFPRDDAWKQRATDADKYVITVGQGSGGWLWKAFGLSAHGSFRELANSGYQAGTYLPSREVAAAGPFVIDGRTLDRAEYVLVVN